MFSKESIFFFKYMFFGKKFNKMLSSQFCHLRRLVFYQSSPVHPVSEFRAGTLSVTYTAGAGQDSVFLILYFISHLLQGDWQPSHRGHHILGKPPKLLSCWHGRPCQNDILSSFMETQSDIICRPRRSQGLLYKHLRHSLID